MEEKDIIYRLLKWFDLSFDTSEDALCLGVCADLCVLLGAGGCGGGSFLSLLAFPAPRDTTATAASPLYKPRAFQWGRGFPWLG